MKVVESAGRALQELSRELARKSAVLGRKQLGRKQLSTAYPDLTVNLQNLGIRVGAGRRQDMAAA